MKGGRWNRDTRRREGHAQNTPWVKAGIAKRRESPDPRPRP